MIETILIANRGEIAVRVIRTCHAQGRSVIAVHSDCDADALHVRLADHAVSLPGKTAAETYLDGDAIVKAANSVGADAVHPGYGFLAENAAFADAVTDAGLVWIGPSAAAIRAMGDKVSARGLVTAAGVPCVPGTTDPIQDASEVEAFGEQHGYPVVIKAAAGGGGRGMRVVGGAHQAADAFAAASREALGSFADPRVYLERYLEWPRHVEVQLLADQSGRCITLSDRDCSVQRRHQKLVEEAPAPALPEDVCRGLHSAAVAVAEAIGYVGAGTVEFLVEGDRFFFLEMNTRLQVEHPVTEEIFRIDLVAEQLRVAEGVALDPSLGAQPPRGHAIEVRINAENVAAGRFLPSPGRIDHIEVPGGPGIRFDGGYRCGDEVPPFYDNLIGKLIVWGSDREEARRRLLEALSGFRLDGVATTIPALVAILEHEDFVGIRHATPWLEERLTFSDASDDQPEPSGENPEYRDDRRLVWVAGRQYVLEPPLEAAVPRGAPAARSARIARRPGGPAPSPRPRSGAPTSTGAVTSPMQGTVIRVAVATGSAITAGDVLCVLEAMKMENEVTAAHDGTVTEVAVAEGQGVAAGEVLFRVE